jgi:transcriptional regulator with XRE-family HTH domain
MVFSFQLRAARALVGMTQAEVARQANLSVPTVKRAEGGGVLGASEDAIAAICKVLESAGVIFIEENGGGAGVRFSKKD